MKKVLITGATGFIGNFLVEEALKRDYDIYITVRITSNKETLADKNVQIFESDFSSTISLHNLIYSLPNFDYVIHNAGVIKSLDKKTFFEVNYLNTVRLIEALVQQNKEPDKFIYISSLAAYGPGEKNLLETIKFINKGIDFQFGTKNQCLTFIYVKDLTRLVFDAIYEFISKAMKRPPVFNVEKVNELSAHNWNCDIQSTQLDFNFKAEYDLEKGMNETIEWYKKEGWM